jgi:aspartate kinase
LSYLEQQGAVNVVVQKFGGTCTESHDHQLMAAERIMECRDQGMWPVAVISAMGREGQPYSTAELVKLVRKIDPKIEPRELDLLMSCGEIISTVAMAHLLKSKGYDTIALSGGQAGLITDSYHGHAQIIDIRPHEVFKALQEGRIVFVAGFQGVTAERHVITTLGEGGSDYTAVALAVTLARTPTLPFGDELHVAPLQVFKEVDGVMTANPKLFEKGKGPAPAPLPSLTYDEMVTMSALGADVLQHSAAVMARKHQLALVVKNFKTDAPGTEISPATGKPSGRLVTGIPDIADLILFSVLAQDGRLAGQLSGAMRNERILHYQLPVDEGRVQFAVKRGKYRNVVSIIEHILFDRDTTAQFSEESWGLVSAVGAGVRGRATHVHSECERALREAGIGVFGALDGDLHVSFLVKEERRTEAVRILHKCLID